MNWKKLLAKDRTALSTEKATTRCQNPGLATAASIGGAAVLTVTRSPPALSRRGVWHSQAGATVCGSSQRGVLTHASKRRGRGGRPLVRGESQLLVALETVRR